MNKQDLKRLWSPLTILLIVLGITFFNQDLLVRFRSEAIDQTQKVLSYVIAIGIWLSAAHFLNRLLIVFVWEGLVEKALRAPVPRLIKDVMSLIIYVILLNQKPGQLPCADTER